MISAMIFTLYFIFIIRLSFPVWLEMHFVDIIKPFGKSIKLFSNSLITRHVNMIVLRKWMKRLFFIKLLWFILIFISKWCSVPTIIRLIFLVWTCYFSSEYHQTQTSITLMLSLNGQISLCNVFPNAAVKYL